jgi:cytidylate kinase
METIIPVVTLDGPSGAGKGTVSRALAERLGWHYLDSGAIYRSLAIAVQDQAIDLADEYSIVAVAQSMTLSFASGAIPRVVLNGQDITDRIGTETCGNTASKVAAIGAVRRVLLQKQREFRRLPGLIADGRDMGTMVFPDAPLKIFLTASAGERALRRYKQLKEKGMDVSLSRLTKELEERDQRDMERKDAPLKPADDAHYLDSSSLTVEQVIDRCLNLIIR